MDHIMTYEEYLRDVKKGNRHRSGQQPGHAAASDASGKVENTDYHDDLVCVAFRWN